MAKPRFGLGRGLDALIPGAEAALEASAPPTPIPQAAPLEVPIGSILPNPRQPRTYITEDDALRELADSIREHGVIQPLVVTDLVEDGQSPRPLGSDRPLYQLIAGERRWQASKLAGLMRVPVIIREVTPQQMLELALIENIQRSDLNPIEEALAYRDLVNDFGLTHEEVGKRVGKSRETVSNAIRLLGLPIDARQRLASRSQEFTPGHARAVLRIQNEDAQREAIERITAQGLTVRAAEELARRYTEAAVQHQPERKSQPQASMSSNHWIEDDFRSKLAMKVQLRQNSKGKGSLTIFFNDQEELHRLYEIIVVRQES
ncbi:MAG TPA: ParB/RepB/Spo0J family partition protein [Ktedonobacterales bacterium]